MACEDFPCCGHMNPDGTSDCPSHDEHGRERWRCTECGKILPLRADSSICDRCQKRMFTNMDYLDWDHSMDY